MASVARTLTRATSRNISFTPLRRNLAIATHARPSTKFVSSFKQAPRRGYASEASPSGGSGKGIFIGLTLAAVGGAGYYLYANDLISGLTGAAGKSSVKPSGPFQPGKGDYQKVYNDVAELLESNDEYDNGSYGPVSFPSRSKYIGTLTDDYPAGPCPPWMARLRDLR